MRHMRAVLVATGLLGVLTMAGCGSNGSTSAGGGTNYPPGTPLAPTSVTTSYMVQTASVTFDGNGNPFYLPQNPDVVLGFGSTATGQVNPVSTLTGPAGYLISGVTTDSTGNLYVLANAITTAGTTGAANLLVYAPGANGQATPLQTVALPAITAGGFYSTASVGSDGQVYLGYYALSGNSYTGGVLVYAASPTTGVSPTRVLSGSLSGLVGPAALAIDNQGNIFVADQGLNEILKFSPGPGDAAPTRTITGFTSASSVPELGGLAVDASGNLYTPVYSTSGLGLIAEYGPSAATASNTLKTIAGPGLSDDQGIYGLAVDAAGNVYGTGAYSNYDQYGNYLGAGLDYFAFAPSASGDVLPANDAIYTQYNSSYFQPIAIH